MLSIADVNFHDSHLSDFTVGPRQELSLKVALDPVWNPKSKGEVVVRMGAVENFATVRSFFEKITRPPEPEFYIAEIVRFESSARGAFLLELDGVGSVEIRSAKLTLK